MGSPTSRRRSPHDPEPSGICQGGTTLVIKGSSMYSMISWLRPKTSAPPVPMSCSALLHEDHGHVCSGSPTHPNTHPALWKPQTPQIRDIPTTYISTYHL